MAPASVLLMLAVTAVIVLGALRLVVVTDLAARVARFRYERLAPTLEKLARFGFRLPD